MGSTNTTANYSLSQFIGTDKPAWLQDYNGDMLKIDTGINAAKVAADGAQNAASAAQNDATTANNAITNTINPAISSLNTTVGNQGGSINTINSLIGNGTPTTTDQTIIGAINEINGYLHDRKVIRVNTSGATTYGALYNAIYTALYNSINDLTEKRGKLVMSNGSIYEWHSLSSSDIRAGMNEDRGDLTFSRYIAHIVNNASTFGIWRGLTTGNTVTDLTSSTASESWVDIYITES